MTPTIDRRGLLRGAAVVPLAAAVPSVLLSAPAASALSTLSTGRAGLAGEAVTGLVPFVDSYRTNLGDYTTPETNAAVRILAGMADLWKTGPTWDGGEVLEPRVLRENMRYCVRITHRRTDEEAKWAFIMDRRHQSYSATDGLGPLAAAYREGALAVTSIVSAPEGVPAGKIDDAVPPGAPAGASTGAGSPDSELGEIVRLVNTVRGTWSSGNPAKAVYLYPRPWRSTVDSEVVPTGEVDAYGFPVYRSDVIVAPQLLLQRSTTPETDGGFPSGHANAAYMATLALAYAIPERFQELVVVAAELGHSRIVAGMHSPVDVIGGRILGTALTAAILSDPVNAELKSAARARALDYFGDSLWEQAHTGPDAYGDRTRNLAKVTPWLTYLSPVSAGHGHYVVPKGAEVLLETRFPYLDAEARREVLRTTALPSGYPLLDGPEGWGRLNLLLAADGYGAFDRSVEVTLSAERGGFEAADRWRNSISGRGGLVKHGSGALTLSGLNTYTGGTSVRAGTLVAESATAFGRGDVRLGGAATLRTSLRSGLTVKGALRIDHGAVLELTTDERRAGGRHVVLRASRISGRFAEVRVDGRRVDATYSSCAVTVRL